MICINVCLISSGLLGAMLMTMLLSNKKQYNQNKLQFNDTQQKIYKLIARERGIIYFKGLILGVLLSSIYIYLTKDMITSNLCTVIAITMMTSVFYYLLAPKKHYMIQYMTSIEQARQWQKIGKKMRHSYNIGFLFGVVLYILVIFTIANESQKK